MDANNYNVGNDENGKPRFRATIEWYDENGKQFTTESTDIEESETLIGLLSGNICLSDLEP